MKKTKKIILISIFTLLAILFSAWIFAGYLRSDTKTFQLPEEAVVFQRKKGLNENKEKYEYEYVGSTKAIVQGELRTDGQGKQYFLGDIWVEYLQIMRHFLGDPTNEHYKKTGIMSSYHYALETQGAEYFNNEETRRRYEIPVSRMDEKYGFLMEPRGYFVDNVSTIQEIWEEYYAYANDYNNIKRGSMFSPELFWDDKEDTGVIFVGDGTMEYIIFIGASNYQETEEIVKERYDWFYPLIEGKQPNE